MFALRVRSLLDVCVAIRSTQIYYEPRGNQERARTYRSWTDRACEWSRVSRPGTLSPPATCKAKERGERNGQLLVATSRDLAACSTLNVAATVAAIRASDRTTAERIGRAGGGGGDDGRRRRRRLRCVELLYVYYQGHLT